MTYTLYYISEDMTEHETPQPAGTWSVYSEQYESIEDADPIEGSTVHITGDLTEHEARYVANNRQRASYSENRKAQADAQG